MWETSRASILGALHAGTANRAPGTRRAMFYLSFRNPRITDPGNPPSFRPCLLSLNDLRGSRQEEGQGHGQADPRPAGGGKKKKALGFASGRK